jgi:hypothetical protein
MLRLYSVGSLESSELSFVSVFINAKRLIGHTRLTYGYLLRGWPASICSRCGAPLYVYLLRGGPASIRTVVIFSCTVCCLHRLLYTVCNLVHDTQRLFYFLKFSTSCVIPILAFGTVMEF